MNELFDATGDVSKAEHPKGQNQPFQKVSETDALVIIEVVLERPGIYLHEIQQYLLEEPGTQVSLPTICITSCTGMVLPDRGLAELLFRGVTY